MLLGNLLKNVSKKNRRISVESISFDSRKVKKNSIFFAIDGIKTTGSRFINEAISNGASAIVVNRKTKYKNNKVPFVIVKDVRKSLSEACSNFYKKKPSNIIAVTGTNGKSSLAYFYYQILNINKISAASLGTLGILSKNFNKKTKLTSMDPLSLHKNLEILAKNKINNVILEASSHGLEQRRLDNLKINTGIFTNLSHDHLDYHKNMKSYFESKMHLFKKLLKKKSNIISDEEIKEFNIIRKIANKRGLKKITIGLNSGNIRVLSNRYKENKQVVKILINSKIFILEVSLIGYFQIKNLLMSILAALCSGLSLEKIIKQIPKIKPVPGRLECVANLKNNSNIIVDFAHTPDALEQSLIALKKQFKKEIILVFGCGGERDKKKRIVMGKVARKYCRKIFVTDDNPRNEDPKKIRRTIMIGCKKIATNIGDRKKAIKKAIDELGANEVLLIAGKGHEKTQDYGNRIINFSDQQVIRNLIGKRKIYFKKSVLSQFNIKNIFNNNKLKNLNYNGVSINTKTIKKNNLFFAIQGKNKDGHKFVKQAINKGAIKSVVSKKIKKLPSNKTIKVKNTFSTLNKLAKHTRERSFAKIIGITGSVGKTTLKNLVSFSLRNYGKVYKSPHSYNNKFGVPYSLSNLKNDTEYGVFEIGMDKKGEIFNLSKIVKPEIGVITNVAEAHFKNFSTLKDIAKAKGEIIDNIVDKGNIILNKDNKFFNYLAKRAIKKKINIISFSLKKKADIYLLSTKKIRNFYRLKVVINNKFFYFDISNNTTSLVNNILACISVLYVLNLDLDVMKKKFIKFEIPSGRGDIKVIKKFKKKFKFIDESYNANPMSMLSAIKNMSYYEREKDAQKIVFLGDMLELGKKSKSFHRSLSNEINRSDIDKVFVYGKDIRITYNMLSRRKKGKIFNNLKEAHNHFAKIVHNNDLLMVKGSNATGLNQFSKNIKKGQINAI